VNPGEMIIVDKTIIIIYAFREVVQGFGNSPVDDKSLQ
jgi:hypothetical protein